MSISLKLLEFSFQLLNFSDRDEEIANMTETFEWFFMPVFNVDGYEFTHKVSRLNINLNTR